MILCWIVVTLECSFDLLRFIAEVLSILLVGFNRETNKAFCGFFQQSKYQQHKRLFREDGCSGVQLHPDVKDSSDICSDNLLV